MCVKVQCPKCKLFTWSGCGLHKEQVMSKIEINERCICNKNEDEDEIKEEENNNNNDNNTKIKLLCSLIGHEERIWCCSWNPKKDILATSSSDRLIKLWIQPNLNDIYKWKCIQTLDGHTRSIRCISWHPLGNLFASASFDGTIGIWQRNLKGIELKFECIDLLEGHDNEIKSLSWDYSGKLLASCSRDKSVWIWEIDDNDLENIQFEVISVKRSHDADIKCVKWHPFKPLLISSSYDNTIKTYKCDLMDDDDWFINQILKKHKSTVWNISFNPLNGNQFVSCSDDKSIIIWEKMQINKNNLDNLAFKFKQIINNIHNEAIYHLDWLYNKQDGINLIATCSGDNSFKIFYQNNNNNNKWQLLIQQNNAHKNDINWIEFGPRIKPGIYLIATASDDNTIKIWQFETKIDSNKFMTKDEIELNNIINEID